ncbi:hypothetical protein [Chitinophaga sancti]|uniref:Uncharacterized protein n=1 Tax=Chitinophaga sancti TaxID=1004 RepID=A0A1K1MPC6_9BACT|nr:hypothetical protein [Chitinophaga sancti]WQD62864.1 hypothetical protein U0033_00550 [Chitinophaga sancti]WQG91512.1 hypothetical protein SR876_08365 [Chitinophaga sancti]SFW25018.1 hypothetical protein SAMN05661012_00760 [Chitinophaga sancti]
MLRRSTWKKFKQPANILIPIMMLAGFVFLGIGCASSRSGNYEPPRLGAEYSFEDGMRREKHPQYLFSNKERKDMRKMGLPAGEQNEAVGGRVLPSATNHLPADVKRDSIPPRDSVYKVLPQ